MTQTILTAAKIFTGTEMLSDHAVVIEGRTIVAVLPVRDVRGAITDLGNGILAPGFIDVQVNGGGGVNLNEKPTVDGVLTIAAAHRRHGTTGLLPTVITDARDVLEKAANAVGEARAKNPAILGLHMEGPFLDITRKGAHEPKFIRAMTTADVTWLSGMACGTFLLTLAPNKVSADHIATLAKAGVIISLGHSEASAAEAKAALASGARGFTHLFNAMSQIAPREPGMAGVALTSAAFAGLIADGFHVHDDLMRLAIAAKRGTLMLVTDAMCSAAGGPGHFTLQGRMVSLRDGRLQLADGTLAGSNLTMDAALRYCVQHLGLDVAEALPLTSTNAAAFLGLGGALGHIKPGQLASLVFLAPDLRVKQTWVEGKA